MQFPDQYSVRIPLAAFHFPFGIRLSLEITDNRQMLGPRPVDILEPTMQEIVVIS